MKKKYNLYGSTQLLIIIINNYCTLYMSMSHCNGCVKIEFNDIKSLYTQNGSVLRRSVSL